MYRGPIEVQKYRYVASRVKRGPGLDISNQLSVLGSLLRSMNFLYESTNDILNVEFAAPFISLAIFPRSTRNTLALVQKSITDHKQLNTNTINKLSGQHKFLIQKNRIVNSKFEFRTFVI